MFQQNFNIFWTLYYLLWRLRANTWLHFTFYIFLFLHAITLNHEPYCFLRLTSFIWMNTHSIHWGILNGLKGPLLFHSCFIIFLLKEGKSVCLDEGMVRWGWRECLSRILAQHGAWGGTWSQEPEIMTQGKIKGLALPPLSVYVVDH